MEIDLNADIGSGCGVSSDDHDAALLGLASSVNIPCGAHAGSPASMLAACAAAAASGRTIGALVGYRDPFGGGERFIDYRDDDLAAEIVYQLGALDGLALTEGTRVTYLRPAGALLEATQTDRHHAWAIVNAVLDYDADLTVVGLAGSALVTTAQRHGLATAVEFHPHRVLRPNGTLGAMITDPALAARRAVEAALAGSCATIRLPGAGAAHGRLAVAVHDALIGIGVAVRPFAEGYGRHRGPTRTA